MDVERKITVELTPDEVKKILISYLYKNEGFNIKDVYFNVETTYSSEMDQHGSVELTNVKCTGLFTTDGN